MPAHATTTMDVDSDDEETGRAAEDDSNDDSDDDDAMDADQHFAPSSSGAAVAGSSSTAAASGSQPQPVASSSGFAPLSAAAQSSGVLKNEFRRIPIPPHRMTPLKREWVNLYTPMVEVLGLQVRMNIKRRAVELKTSNHTVDSGAVQKGADFVKAFALGFDVKDAIALLRLDDLYLDSFEIKDVKTLHGDHLARAIGRIAGEGGKVKFSIENASRTRIVLADSQIHILGSVQNIKIARDAVVSLILGSPPGKVYAHLKTVGARMKQRF